MSEQKKENDERKEKDLEPKKDAKGGGGFGTANNPIPSGGGTSTQPVNPPGQ
jgi:hypothetical protein